MRQRLLLGHSWGGGGHWDIEFLALVPSPDSRGKPAGCLHPAHLKDIGSWRTVEPVHLQEEGEGRPAVSPQEGCWVDKETLFQQVCVLGPFLERYLRAAGRVRVALSIPCQGTAVHFEFALCHAASQLLPCIANEGRAFAPSKLF